MNADRPFLGVLLMLGFCILAPLGDAIAKLLSVHIPILQLLTVRFGVQAAVLIPVVWFTGKKLLVSRRITALTIVRTILHAIGIWAMFLSLRFLPLADAVAIAFVMPFIMLLLGKYVLNEEVGPNRLIACAVGFVGTLLVIQPNFASVGWPALLPLIVAVDFAFFMLVTRQIAKQIDPIALQAVSGMMATCVLIPVLFFLPEGGLLQVAVTPTPNEVWLLLTLGLVGTVAHLLMTWSLRFAPSATLAPMQYLEIPFATFIGWVIFHDLPNGLAAVGIAITVSAGLYIVLRERAISMSKLSQPPQDPRAVE